MTSPGWKDESRCMGMEYWDDTGEKDGEVGRRGVKYRAHMYTHGGFKSMYGKTNTIL